MNQFFQKKSHRRYDLASQQVYVQFDTALNNPFLKHPRAVLYHGYSFEFNFHNDLFHDKNSLLSFFYPLTLYSFVPGLMFSSFPSVS